MVYTDGKRYHMSLLLRKPEFLTKDPVELNFGTSGLRGPVTVMTDMECYINTRAFLDYLKGINNINDDDVICIAGDLRPSTPRIMSAVEVAIIDSGCKVENCGSIPTPAVAYYAMLQDRAGVMVTGSHIPVDRNGIKYYKRGGEVLKADEAGILAAVATIRSEEYAKNAAETTFDKNGSFKQPRQITPAGETAAQTYIKRYLDVFPPDIFSGKTILVYQHTAVGRDILTYILEKLGAKVIPVKRSEEFLAFDTENITKQDRELFWAIMLEYRGKKPFAMVTTDGDSDRPLIVDENGEAYRGDVLGILVCQYLKARFASVPVSANMAVTIQLEKEGVTLQSTKIGSPYVIEAMNNWIREGKSPVVGRDVNGGFLTGTDIVINGKMLKALPTRDSILPLLCVLAQGVDKKIPVSALFTLLPQYYTDAGLLDNFPPDISKKILAYYSPPEEDNIKQVSYINLKIIAEDNTRINRELVSTNPLGQVLLTIKSELERFFNTNYGFTGIRLINYQDGIRIRFANSDIAHLRPSGNAPQFRVYSNATTQERASEIVKLCLAEPDGIIHQMKNNIGNVPSR
jgi:phosphomannomutase